MDQTKKITNLITLLVAALLIVAILGGIGYLGFCFYAAKTYPSLIAKEIEAMKAQGEPVSTQQLIPGQVADKDNAAICYYKAFALAAKLPVPMEATPQVYKQFKPQFEKMLLNARPFFALMKEGYEKPGCRYNYSDGPGRLMVKIEELSPGRIVNLTLLQVFSQTDRQDLLGAAQTMTYCLKFVRTLQPDFYLLSGASRQNLLATLQKGFDYMFKGGFKAYNAPLMEEVQYVTKNDRETWIRAFCGERATGLELLNQTPETLSGFLDKNYYCHAEHLGKLTQVFSSEYRSPFKGMLYFEQLTYLRWWKQVIAYYKKTGEIPSHSSGVILLKSADFFCTYTLSSSYTLALSYPSTKIFRQQYAKLEKQLMAFKNPVSE